MLFIGNSNGSSHMDYIRLDTFIKNHPDVVLRLQQAFNVDSLIPDKFIQPVGVVSSHPLKCICSLSLRLLRLHITFCVLDYLY